MFGCVGNESGGVDAQAHDVGVLPRQCVNTSTWTQARMHRQAGVQVQVQKSEATQKHTGAGARAQGHVSVRVQGCTAVRAQGGREAKVCGCEVCKCSGVWARRYAGAQVSTQVEVQVCVGVQL